MIEKQEIAKDKIKCFIMLIETFMFQLKISFLVVIPGSMFRHLPVGGKKQSVHGKISLIHENDFF